MTLTIEVPAELAARLEPLPEAERVRYVLDLLRRDLADLDTDANARDEHDDAARPVRGDELADTRVALDALESAEKQGSHGSPWAEGEVG